MAGCRSPFPRSSLPLPISSPQQYQYVSAEGRSTCCVTDLGVASGLYHLSPSGFARVLELPPIHLEGRLVWGLTGRAGPAGVWVLHPPLLQAPVSAQGNDVVLKGGEKGVFLGWGGVSIHAGMDGRCPNNPAWMGDAKSHGAGPRLCLHTCHGGVPGLQMEPPHEKNLHQARLGSSFLPETCSMQTSSSGSLFQVSQ